MKKTLIIIPVILLVSSISYLSNNYVLYKPEGNINFHNRNELISYIKTDEYKNLSIDEKDLIFQKFVKTDSAYKDANEATKLAIRQRFGMLTSDIDN